MLAIKNKSEVSMRASEGCVVALPAAQQPAFSLHAAAHESSRLPPTAPASAAPCDPGFATAVWIALGKPGSLAGLAAGTRTAAVPCPHRCREGRGLMHGRLKSRGCVKQLCWEKVV